MNNLDASFLASPSLVHVCEHSALTNEGSFMQSVLDYLVPLGPAVYVQTLHVASNAADSLTSRS